MLPTGFALETPAQSIISVAYPKKLIVACKNVAMESWDKAVEDFKVDETFSAPALPGVDAQYGFCGAATDAPDARKCFLFLAHGDRAEALQSSEVNDEGLKPGKAKKSLLTTLPMFAAAFTKDR